jgi:CelD/BcsL family acetyltransferase involved in cellulose biosynthesis
MIEVFIQPLDPADKHIESEWRRLENTTKSTFFTSWDWTGTLLATLPTRTGLILIRLSVQGETVGLGYFGQESARRHLIVWSKRLHLNSPGKAEFNCMTTEDNLLLAQPEFEKACWDAILGWFAHKQTIVDELVLPGLRDPLDLTSERQRFAYDTIELRSWHVDLRRLGVSNGQFVDLLSPNARYQLRRSMKDYGGRVALQLAEAQSAEEALVWFDNMKMLHIESWTRRKKRHAFSCRFFEVFHRNLIQRTFSTGRIQMLRIDANGSPIGYLYNFRDGLCTYAYQSGFADKDRRLRPGAVSHALAIEHNFTLGAHVYDFMAGTNQLKSTFATDWRYMYWITVQLPRMRFKLENFGHQIKHRVSDWTRASSR